VAAVTGCGSSHRRAVQASSVPLDLRPVCVSGCGVHSPNHRYSVPQVEAAFASQGIHLHKAAKQVVPYLVILRYGSYRRLPQQITVVVRTGRPNDLVELGSSKAYLRPRITRHGNVIAAYDPADSAAVKSALTELH
jgi:hypothetical protein